jgi:pimeloyl-ACP methyl ester carboxylesterase
MATYVLVHGGWHGAWCWKKVVPLLEAAGQRLYTPTLTGLGEKAHLLSPEVGLATHIQDVVQVIEENRLLDVILLGHSYSGMVITGVVDRVPERIRHLVYLDAVVPLDGASMADISPMVINGLRKDARAHGDGWRVSPPRELPFGRGGAFGVTQEPDLSWVRSSVGPQSLKTFEEPLHLKDPDIVSKKARTFIRCTRGLPVFLINTLQRLLLRHTLSPTGPGWRFRVLDAGHDCMITNPKEVSDLLLELVEP